MKSSIYVITDTKANRTTEPFSCPTDEAAKRNFLFGCFASETPPQDCVLWKLADYIVDDSDASVFSLNVLNNGFKVINPTIEEINAYHQIYFALNPDKMDSEDYEDLMTKGYEQFKDKGVL